MNPSEFIKGNPNDCFRNTLVAQMNDDTLKYVEGYLLPGLIHHAWAVRPDGSIVECTMSPELASRFSYKQGRTFTREEVERRWYANKGRLPLMSAAELAVYRDGADPQNVGEHWSMER